MSDPDYDDDSWVDEGVPCESCGGSGLAPEGWDCPDCDGTGYWDF